jgi:hypothetical protein
MKECGKLQSRENYSVVILAVEYFFGGSDLGCGFIKEIK